MLFVCHYDYNNVDFFSFHTTVTRKSKLTNEQHACPSIPSWTIKCIWFVIFLTYYILTSPNLSLYSNFVASEFQLMFSLMYYQNLLRKIEVAILSKHLPEDFHYFYLDSAYFHFYPLTFCMGTEFFILLASYVCASSQWRILLDKLSSQELIVVSSLRMRRACSVQRIRNKPISHG